MPQDEIAENITALQTRLEELLLSSLIPFDKGCHGSLPELPGVYRIFRPDRPSDTIRAGRTDSTLRQRVYQNHLMGDQAGNLAPQLVRCGDCVDLRAAKQFIRENLVVQVLAVPDQRERAWLEHFILAVLRPRFSDRSQA
jgi:hypothetical protein